MESKKITLQALKVKFEKALKVKKQEAETKNWDLLARVEQKIPEGDWFGWLIMAGRGFGKTRTGAETIRHLIKTQNYRRIAIVGETYDQVRSIMIEGESGLLNVHSKQEKLLYRPSRKEIIWPNGAIASFFSAENYEALRGPQFDLCWVDELAKFQNSQQVWDQLMFCLRLGNQPRIIMTTTPRPTDLMFKLCSRKDIHLTQGSTMNNKKNLSQNFLNMIEREYGNTTLGKQEINGELIEQNTSALWNYSNFYYEKSPQDLINQMDIVIAIDPAITSNSVSNETGIIVAGRLNEKFYVLEDASAQMNCTAWMNKAYELFEKYNAKKIIVEVNQGGDILMSMLENFKKIPWEGVRAKDSKYNRAVPIATLYEQKKVIHDKKFEILEEQLVKAHLSFGKDRLDALVWALHNLQSFEVVEKNLSLNNFNIIF